MEYVIAWRSLITGFEGQSIIGFAFDTAKARCDELNLEYAGIIHHWPKAVAPETLDTQPNYEPSVGDVVQFQYSTETKPKLILGTVASRFDVGKWRITTELHGTFIRLTGDLKLVSRAIVAVDTSDLPTQPIVIDDGVDTIILRPAPVCEKCGGVLISVEAVEDEGPDGDELEMWQCSACGSITLDNYAELYFGE